MFLETVHPSVQPDLAFGGCQGLWMSIAGSLSLRPRKMSRFNAERERDQRIIDAARFLGQSDGKTALLLMNPIFKAQ